MRAKPIRCLRRYGNHGRMKARPIHSLDFSSPRKKILCARPSIRANGPRRRPDGVEAASASIGTLST